MSTFDVRSERRPGHFWADNEILDVYAPQIGIFGFAVYMAIVRFADNHGVARPSVATLATRLKVGENTIRRAIAILEEVGLLRIEQQTRERDGHTSYLSNRYVICTVPKGEQEGYFTTGGTSRGEPPTSRGEPPTSRGEPPTSRGEPLKKKTLSTKLNSQDLSSMQQRLVAQDGKDLPGEDDPATEAAAILARVRTKRGSHG